MRMLHAYMNHNNLLVYFLPDINCFQQAVYKISNSSRNEILLSDENIEGNI